MAERIKIEKNTISETLVLPLYGRAHCSRRYPDIFADPEAERIMPLLDYNFGALRYKEFVLITWAVRVRMLCDRARAYLAHHPRATIVNLGCGADTSFARIDNGLCRFINLDLPKVIAARERIVPRREREKNVAADAFDTSWLQHIDTPISDGVFIISGGVLMYFEAERLKPLFNTLAQQLPGGGICFDGESDFAVRRSNRILERAGNTGALVKFAVNDASSTFGGWSDRFADIRIFDRMPADIARAKSLPIIPKSILKMGFKKGLIKFVEIEFSRDGCEI
ncbi:MAG: class I SAM-dependent methyltransferase [Bacteroidales bacterium]|nr:class I SAM-dependent methyltransferase [Bacteroidales bacterium]